MNDFIVYIHRLKTDGRVYVGQTRGSLKQRAGSNGHRYKHCPKFYNAIQKYGWDSFEHIVVATGLTIDEANQLEDKLIKEYNSINNGFNINLGGRNHTYTEEQRKAMSERMKGSKNLNFGKPRSEETKRKIGETVSKALLEKTHSEETKEKIRKSHQKDIPIICIETGKIYSCPSEASWDVHQTRVGGHITEVCKGIRKTAFGFHWKYYLEEDKSSKENE